MCDDYIVSEVIRKHTRIVLGDVFSQRLMQLALKDIYNFMYKSV